MQCGSCHALDHDYAKAPAHGPERAGPPLDHAGNMFRREWLFSWLQNPVRLRPAAPSRRHTPNPLRTATWWIPPPWPNTRCSTQRRRGKVADYR